MALFRLRVLAHQFGAFQFYFTILQLVLKIVWRCSAVCIFISVGEHRANSSYFENRIPKQRVETLADPAR